VVSSFATRECPRDPAGPTGPFESSLALMPSDKSTRRSGPVVRPVTKLLAANRSEIAVRVFRAATELGLRTVGVFAQEDRFCIHRYKADEAYQVGEGRGPVAAYLDIASLIGIAKAKSVDAIHPGYGFLSENAEFARACDEAGILFVGPRPELLDRMGDKTAARAAARAAGVPG
jgi:pyruvate carboxylase